MRARTTAVVLVALLGLALEAAAEEKRGRFLGAKETVYPEWFKESFLELEADVDEAARADRRILLFFHQDGCPYCNLLVERNLAQKDIEEHLRRHFDVIALNMWGDREVVSVDGETYTEKTFARALEVQFTPTLLFMDEDGRVALRINGYYPPREFRAALDYVVERKYEKTTFRDHLASLTPATGSGELNPEPFFASPPYVLSRGGSPAQRPLAVFFEQRQCPNCDRLHEQVLTDPRTRDLVEQFESVQLDMWSDTPVITPDNERTTAREWAKALGVAYAPTIVLFDRHGEEVIRTDSYFKIFHTQSVLDYVRSGAYRTQPSFQRYISARADALRERGIDVDIWR